MCSVTEAQTILDVIEDFKNDEKVFTAFDVTVEARTRTPDKISHRDTRRILNGEFGQMVAEGWDRELLPLNVKGNPSAFVYSADGHLADEHSLVTATTDEDDEDEDVEDGEIVCTLTAKKRLNIPKNLLSQLDLSSGSVDVQFNNDTIYGKVENDGRVRLSLKQFNVSKDSVKVSVLDNKTLVVNE